MKLEEAIQLSQQQLENEPERLIDERSVITEYGSIFNPNNIPYVNVSLIFLIILLTVHISSS
jgi:hypothetical protein